MKALIIDRTDQILSEETLEDGDFALIGSGALSMTVMVAGVPDRLLLLENWGRVIAEGRFFKDISLSKRDHFPGDQITIRLAPA